MRKLGSTITLLALAGFSTGAYSEQPKVSICHNYQNITVAQPSVEWHLAHGDTLEPCVVTPEEPGTGTETPPETAASVVMMRCDGAAVVSLSGSANAGELLAEGSCPEVLANLLDTMELKSVTGGSGADGPGLLHLYTDYLLLGAVPVEPAPL